MNIYDEIEKFLEDHKEWEGFDELFNGVNEFLSNNKNVKSHRLLSDVDVFDGSVTSIYYLSICWVDLNNNIDIYGYPYYIYKL